MADKKISALTPATTPLAGTEVLPIVQGASTVNVPVSDLTAGRTVAVKNLTTSLANSNDIVKLERTGSNPGFGFIFANDGQMFGVHNGTLYPFLVAQGAGTGSLEVDASSNVNVGNGNLVIGTSGKGIDFSADGQAAGMTSELLDDYEEGTWTPTYTGSTTNPTVTYELQTGLYTKVGRMVTCTCRLSTSGITGAGSGNLSISGLPFTPASGVNYSGSIANCTWWTNYPINCLTNSGAKILLYKRSAINGTDSSMVTGDMANGNGYNYAFVTITYFV